MTTRHDVLQSAAASLNNLSQADLEKIADGWSTILGRGLDTTEVTIMLTWLHGVQALSDRANPQHWAAMAAASAAGAEASAQAAGLARELDELDGLADLEDQGQTRFSWAAPEADTAA